MKELGFLLNEMVSEGVITTYAIFGAAAQMRYTQAVVTMDVDVLVAIPQAGDFVLLEPIYKFCREHGYMPEGEAIRVGVWPVQFIPAFDDLTSDAMNKADVTDLEGVNIRVVSADYLALIALKTGRPKDKTRILALLESEAVSTASVQNLALQYRLANEWEAFMRNYVNE